MRIAEVYRINTTYVGKESTPRAPRGHADPCGAPRAGAVRWGAGPVARWGRGGGTNKREYKVQVCAIATGMVGGEINTACANERKQS